MRGIDKLEAAAFALEKLDDGMDTHGDALAGRLIRTSERLEEVVTRGHRDLDVRDAVIDRMDRTIERLNSALGGNGDPTKRSPIVSSASGGSSKASPGAGSDGGAGSSQGAGGTEGAGAGGAPVGQSVGTLDSKSGGM